MKWLKVKYLHISYIVWTCFIAFFIVFVHHICREVPNFFAYVLLTGIPGVKFIHINSWHQSPHRNKSGTVKSGHFADQWTLQKRDYKRHGNIGFRVRIASNGVCPFAPSWRNHIFSNCGIRDSFCFFHKIQKLPYLPRNLSRIIQVNVFIQSSSRRSISSTEHVRHVIVETQNNCLPRWIYMAKENYCACTPFRAS